MTKLSAKYHVVSSRKPLLGEIEHLLHYVDIDIPYTRGYIMGTGEKDIVLVVPASWNPEEGMARLNSNLDAVVSQMDGFKSSKWNIQVLHDNDPRLKDHSKVEIKH